jgi:hypothetical protein
MRQQRPRRRAHRVPVLERLDVAAVCELARIEHQPAVVREQLAAACEPLTAPMRAGNT